MLSAIAYVGQSVHRLLLIVFGKIAGLNLIANTRLISDRYG